MKHRRENKTATRTAPALRTRCCPSGQHSEEEQHHRSGLSRNFVGNHCNKYIQQATTENICLSVVRKTHEVTDNHDLHNKAHDIAEKHQHLNLLCAQVHKFISHTQPITGSEISLARDSIKNCRIFFRHEFPHLKITPVRGSVY